MDNIKVLCFNGFGQDEWKFNKSLASIRSLYKNKVTFDILMAPNKLPITKNKENEDIQTYAWWYYSKEDPLNVNWADMFDTIENENQLHGLDISIEYVKKYLAENSNYDYYLGFSQGAAFLSLLCQKNIIKDAKKLIFCSGFYPLKLSNVNSKINIRSLHLMGLIDEIIPHPQSMILAELFIDGQIIQHKGRHVIPKIKKLFD